MDHNIDLSIVSTVYIMEYEQSIKSLRYKKKCKDFSINIQLHINSIDVVLGVLGCLHHIDQSSFDFCFTYEDNFLSVAAAAAAHRSIGILCHFPFDCELWIVHGNGQLFIEALKCAQHEKEKKILFLQINVSVPNVSSVSL